MMARTVVLPLGVVTLAVLLSASVAETTIYGWPERRLMGTCTANSCRTGTKDSNFNSLTGPDSPNHPTCATSGYQYCKTSVNNPSPITGYYNLDCAGTANDCTGCVHLTQTGDSFTVELVGSAAGASFDTVWVHGGGPFICQNGPTVGSTTPIQTPCNNGGNPAGLSALAMCFQPCVCDEVTFDPPTIESTTVTVCEGYQIPTVHAYGNCAPTTPLNLVCTMDGSACPTDRIYGCGQHDIAFTTTECGGATLSYTVTIGDSITWGEPDCGVNPGGSADHQCYAPTYPYTTCSGSATDAAITSSVSDCDVTFTATATDGCEGTEFKTAHMTLSSWT